MTDMMDMLIRKFPVQLKEALEAGMAAEIKPHHFQINKIIMTGMGGSAIGGKYVSDLIADECKCPYIVNSSYHLPAFADKHTLIIVSSYSGNTEETISCLQEALSTGAKIVCLSSGGKINAIAQEHHLDQIMMPSGCPSPRAMLGYSIVFQLNVLFHLGIIPFTVLDNIRVASDLLIFEQDDIISKAEKIATLLHQKIPVIYTSDKAESVAIRWRQQINENAKMLCWHHVIPEMNHNELVGWKHAHPDIAVVFLRYKDDVKRIQSRIDITKQTISNLAGTVIEIFAKGQSWSEKMLYLSHLCDWVSWYLAQLNQVDASEIHIIDHLKTELSKTVV